MRKYPSDKEIYLQILKENQRRGFGLLLAYTNLGCLGTKEPSWAEVYLVGEDYHLLLFQINPHEISHDIEDKRFVYSKASRVGLVAVRRVLQEYLPQQRSELLQTKLYLLKVIGAEEYFSEVGEEVCRRSGNSLRKLLEGKRPLKF